MFDSLNDKNYYEILEVPSDADYETIHKGFKRAKSAYSQDSLALYSLMGTDECQKILTLIDEAYSIISDPEKRRRYDEARGLNKGIEYKTNASSHSTQGQSPKESNQENKDFQSSKPNQKEGDMPRMMAKRKFTLSYDIDQSFEKEIEQTTEFTGEFLQKIREYNQVDIPRLAEMTRVSKNYIRYIEQEYFEGLPAMVYTRGFVYQYAKCLKLNPDLVATSYIHRYKKSRGEA